MKWNHWESWSWSKHILDNPFFTYQFCLINGDISFYRTGCLTYLKRPLVMSPKCLGVPDRRLFSVSWKMNETLHKRHAIFVGVSRLHMPQKVTLGYMVHKKSFKSILLIYGVTYNVGCNWRSQPDIGFDGVLIRYFYFTLGYVMLFFFSINFLQTYVYSSLVDRF